MTSKQKTKGSNFERELAAWMNERLGTTDIKRAPLSGGGNIQTSGMAFGGADLMNTPRIFVEAKRVEKLNFPDAYRQVQRNAKDVNSPNIPVVINRRSYQKTHESYVLLNLDDFMTLWESHLLFRGDL